MATYSYKAYDASGGKCSGEIDANSISDVQNALVSDGLFPYEIKDISVDKPFNLIPEKVTLADLEFVTSELSLLLSTGVRIDRGLDIIRKTKAKPVLAKLLADLSNSLKQGNTLSSACKKHPQVFDSLYCNLVALGEASGDLAGVFSRLADNLKFRRDLKKKIISALTYPLVILIVCFSCVFFIFNVIIPKMAEMFTQAKSLPWYTEAMLRTSEWMVSNQLFLLLLLSVFISAIMVGMKNDKFVKWWHQVSLKLPLLSVAIETTERIRFNTGLSLMLKSGLPIDRALELATGSIVNHFLNNEMDIARKKIKRGEQLTSSLKQTSIYPPFYVSLLEVGEESGNLERVFDEIASRSKDDFDTWTTRLTSLLEPLMILFMGVFVGGVVVVMMLSMISINDVGF
ncbi:secretion system protein [Pseudoalteromonas sp. MSK9-3]|uniref:type II secretion system F family protein n=1 Tax=Pseudoalteromonas sp. MSK9-3 TaxID=1897633 RepID=UPI000E6BE884|nr:type II secretion system F family protein [Pseudoalteromonas sp. MSK9-3]RJE76906.1 secretion system protein [Pseudoalteromonas sp. MSK9-3]